MINWLGKSPRACERGETSMVDDLGEGLVSEQQGIRKCCTVLRAVTGVLVAELCTGWGSCCPLSPTKLSTIS